MIFPAVRRSYRSLQWQKSLQSANNGACVEVAQSGPMILVRDSKSPRGSALTYTPQEWSAFIDGVKKGEFDHFGETANE